MKFAQSLRLFKTSISFGPIRPGRIILRPVSRTTSQMSSQREDSIPHKLRTAAEPRQNRRHPVQLSHIEQVNPSVRLLQFALSPENNVCFYFCCYPRNAYSLLMPTYYMYFYIKFSFKIRFNVSLRLAIIYILCSIANQQSNNFLTSLQYIVANMPYRTTASSHSASSRANGSMSTFPQSPKQEGSP
jgi:hypothetical protein